MDRFRKLSNHFFVWYREGKAPRVITRKKLEKILSNYIDKYFE